MKKISIILLFILSFIMLSGCVNSKLYSEKKHQERVEELVKKRYLGENSKYESYEIHPLYDENDTLKYFIVDFEPEGFVWIIVNEYDWCVGPSMYTRDEASKWQKFQYELDENGKQVKVFEKDKSGNDIYYNKSPYKIANVKDEKRYLLKLEESGKYISAIKINDKYLNLISMKEVEYEKGMPFDDIEYTFVSFIGKAEFDL